MSAAAEWAKSLDLHLDLESQASPVCRVTGTAAVVASLPELVEGDKRMLRLYFGVRSAAGAWTPYSLSAGDTVTVVGKRASGAGASLFSADGFAKVGSEAPYYTARLDLDTVPLAAAMVGRRLDVRVDVEIKTAAGETRATLQADGVVVARVYKGIPQTVEGGPAHYTAAQIDAKIIVPAGRRIVFDEYGGITVEAIS